MLLKKDLQNITDIIPGQVSGLTESIYGHLIHSRCFLVTSNLTLRFPDNVGKISSPSIKAKVGDEAPKTSEHLPPYPRGHQTAGLTVTVVWLGRRVEGENHRPISAAHTSITQTPWMTRQCVQSILSSPVI